MSQVGQCEVVIGGRTIGEATHAIVLPDQPTPSENWAARELQAHIERITGRLLPMVMGPAPEGRSWLVVGKHPVADALGVPVDYDALGVEGVRLKTVGPHLILTGNRRGVLYAAYAFLDEHLGCRWFTPDCATWPTRGRIAVRDLDVTFVPALEYRATDYPASRPPEFAVRNRLNGTQIDASEAWGGKVSYRGFVHTFAKLIPPSEYFGTHPEYFSEINGVRVGEGSQICLTNPGALKVATETVRRWIRESPEATIISVSQNDWNNYCTCRDCTALAESEGSQSGPLLHFVNAIARDIAKDHPHVIIDTLAYTYTRKPPRHVKPEPNVAVRLCSIECEFNRPLDASRFNRSFVDDIRGWNAICQRLHIWDYVINYAHCVQPFPNLHVLQPNIRFFVRNGVKGVYEEANYFTKGGEFAELRAYLLARLLWDPDADVNKAIDEFLAAFYGAAAGPIRAYIDDMHKLAVSDPRFHMRIYVPPQSPFQTPEAVARHDAWFEEAERQVAHDPVRLQRVQTARLPVLYTQITRRPKPAFRLTATELTPTRTSGDTAALVARFETISRQSGLTHVAEGNLRTVGNWISALQTYEKPEPVIRLAGKGISAVVVPGRGGRLLSLRYGARELLKVVGSREALDPFDSARGYKEFSEGTYGSPGWTEPYEVVSRDDRSVTLSATLSNGLGIRRRYEMDATRPILRISSTVTNIGAKVVTACLRVHPCFRLSKPAEAVLRPGPPGAAATAMRSSGTDRYGELWLCGEKRPDGEWTLIQPGGLLTSRFKTDQVERCYASWNTASRLVTLELWSAPRSLAPGEHITLEHEYEIQGRVTSASPSEQIEPAGHPPVRRNRRIC